MSYLKKHFVSFKEPPQSLPFLIQKYGLKIFWDLEENRQVL